MIELGIEPGVRAVARLTRGGKTGSLVVRIDGSLEIRGVARKAGRCQPLELPHRFALVAVRTFKRGVHSKQRKPVAVLLQFLGVNVPAFDGVTLLACGAQLSAMDVRVACGAGRADLLELEVRMAFGAAHFFVHAEKRIASAVVVEFRNTANRFPTGVGVAVFAGDVDDAVRIPARFFLRVNGMQSKGEEEPSNDCHLD